MLATAILVIPSIVHRDRHFLHTILCFLSRVHDAVVSTGIIEAQQSPALVRLRTASRAASPRPVGVLASPRKDTMSADPTASGDDLLALRQGAMPNSTLSLTPTDASTPRDRDREEKTGAAVLGGRLGGGTESRFELKAVEERVPASSSQYISPSPDGASGSSHENGATAGAGGDRNLNAASPASSVDPSPVPLDPNAPAAAAHVGPAPDSAKARCLSCLDRTKLWLLWAFDTAMFYMLTAYDNTVAYCAGGGYRPKRRKRMGEVAETDV